jgi:hypothetical protein
MKSIELVTISPFYSKNYSTIYPHLNKKQLLSAISLFILIQMVIAIVPLVFFIPKLTSSVRHIATNALIAEISAQEFTLLTYKSGNVTVDLQKMPLTYTLRENTASVSKFILDFRAETTPETVFPKKEGNRPVIGYALTASGIHLQDQQGSVTSLPYSTILSKDFSISKTDLLAGLQNGSDIVIIRKMLLRPISILTMIGLLLFLFILYFIYLFAMFVFWTGIMTLVVFSFMKKSSYRRPQSLVKSTTFAYIGYWYLAHFLSTLAIAIPLLASINPLVTGIVLPILCCVVVYRGKQEEVLIDYKNSKVKAGLPIN